MIFLYGIFIFVLLIVTTFHVSEHQQKKIMKVAYGLISFVFIIGIAFAVFKLQRNNILDNVFFIPLISAAFVGALAVLLKFTVWNKKNTLCENRKPALICWLCALIVPLILPLITINVNINKAVSETESTTVIKKAYVSLFGLLKCLNEHNASFESFMLFVFPIVIIPIIALAVNYFARNSMYIWANIMLLAAHFTGLCNMRMVWNKTWLDDSSLKLSEMLTKLYIEKGNAVLDKVNLEYRSADVFFFSGIGYNLIAVSMIFLCSWLAVAKFYYIYKDKEAK